MNARRYEILSYHLEEARMVSHQSSCLKVP